MLDCENFILSLYFFDPWKISEQSCGRPELSFSKIIVAVECRTDSKTRCLKAENDYKATAKIFIKRYREPSREGASLRRNSWSRDLERLCGSCFQLNF